jgi:hypothetical protein
MASTVGTLGNQSSGILSRVSYVADYYDAANRLTAEADYGTNGGSSWTRPSTVPSASDTILVTNYGYAGDNVQQVQLTGNPTGGTFTLTFNGQTTSAIAYNASASTVQSALQALSSIGSGNVLVSPVAQAAGAVFLSPLFLTLLHRSRWPRRWPGSSDHRGIVLIIVLFLMASHGVFR